VRRAPPVRAQALAPEELPVRLRPALALQGASAQAAPLERLARAAAQPGAAEPLGPLPREAPAAVVLDEAALQPEAASWALSAPWAPLLAAEPADARAAA
jgi:hypothetical protein